MPYQTFRKVKIPRKVACKWCGMEFYANTGAEYCIDHKLKEFRFENERKKV